MAETHPDSPHPYHQMAHTILASHHRHQYSHGQHYAQPLPMPFPRPGPDALSYFPDVEVLRRVQEQKEHEHHEHHDKMTFEQRGRTLDRRGGSHRHATHFMNTKMVSHSHNRHMSNASSSHFSDDDEEEEVDEEDDREELDNISPCGERRKSDESGLHSEDGSTMYSVSLSSSSSLYDQSSPRHHREASVVDGVLFCNEGGCFDRKDDGKLQSSPFVPLNHRFSHLRTLADQQRTSYERGRRYGDLRGRPLPTSKVHARYVPKDRKPAHARPTIPIEFLPHPHRMARISLELASSPVGLRRSRARLPMPRRHSSHDVEHDN